MADDLEKLTASIPGGAVDGEKAEYLEATRDTLRALSLLPTGDDLAKVDGAKGFFAGSPPSVAVIEAGATAFSKWWAAGLGAAVAAAWTAVKGFWGSAGATSQGSLIWAAGIASAAGLLGVAYIVGSDVRGRSAAAVATIEARAKIADALIRMSEEAFRPAAAPATAQVTALPELIPNVTFLKDKDTRGWTATAVKTEGDQLSYLIHKGSTSHWVAAGDVSFP